MFRMAIHYPLKNATLFTCNPDPAVFFTTRTSYIRFFDAKILCAWFAGVENADKIV